MGSTSANDERQFVLAKYDYIAQGNQELDMKRNERTLKDLSHERRDENRKNRIRKFRVPERQSLL